MTVEKDKQSQDDQSCPLPDSMASQAVPINVRIYSGLVAMPLQETIMLQS